MHNLTLKEAASWAGVSPETLRRWGKEGVIPEYRGRWTAAAAAHARVVKRLRARGHSLDAIKRAGENGTIAFGHLEELFPPERGDYTLAEVAKQSGIEPALIERILTTIGLNSQSLSDLTVDDLEVLQHIAEILESDLPLVAFLQVMRVYGQAMAQIADAEVKLFHIYVHEPLIREGTSGEEMSKQLGRLAQGLLPRALPVMNWLHWRFLQQFVEQDIVRHMDTDLEGHELGWLKVAIAFADLAGYTRFTEEKGDEQAVNAVEDFVSAVETTLPDDARVLKTIGDEVMIIASDPLELVQWSVGFQMLYRGPFLARIGVHYGESLYRDGDYYGREVNLASRVVARAAGGEVLVTREVVEQGGSELDFELIGSVQLKGFADPTELYIARGYDEQ